MHGVIQARPKVGAMQAVRQVLRRNEAGARQ